MSSDEIALDSERLVALRKRDKVTQKSAAEKIGISPRLYSDYENKKIKTTVSHSVLHTIAKAFNVPTYYLWGSIPRDATIFCQVTRLHSNWAKILSEGLFFELKVIGTPDKSELREPLLKLIDTFEAKDTFGEDEKLSVSTRRRFEIDDCIKLLSGETEVDWHDNEKAFSGPARFAVAKIPVLKCKKTTTTHPETDQVVSGVSYNWKTMLLACIDFDYTDFEDNPYSYDYVRGHKWRLPSFHAEGADIHVDPMEVDDLFTEECKALGKRREIHYEDFEETVEFFPEGVVSGSPDVGQLEASIDAEEPDEKIKEQEETKNKKKKDGNM